MFFFNMIRWLFLFLKNGKIYTKIILKIYWIWIVIFLSSCHFIEPSEPFQEGTWVSETCRWDIRLAQDFYINLSYRDSYIILQKTIVLKRDFFIDSTDCTESDNALQQKVFFTIEKISNDSQGNVEILLMLEKTELYAVKHIKNFTNIFIVCGIEDWENFFKKDIRDINCPSSPIIYVNQRERYTIVFYFKNGILLELLSEKREHGRRFIKVQLVGSTRENNQP